MANTEIFKEYLPLSGGTMTGDLTFKSGKKDTDYLPLSGGTMTGGIKKNGGDIISGENNTGYLNFCGGTSTANGTYLSIFGKDNTMEPGGFWLAANNGTTSKVFKGKPGGALTWDGCPINYCFNRVAGAKTRAEIVALYPLDYSTFEVVTSFATTDVPVSGDNGNYHVKVQRYNSSYVVMTATKYQRGFTTYQCYCSAGTWSTWTKCMCENKEALTGMTRATMLDKSDLQFETTKFTNVRFTAAESPTGSDTTTFNVEIRRITDYNGKNCLIIANNSMYTWHCPITQGTIGSWQRVLTQATQPISLGTINVAGGASTLSIDSTKYGMLIIELTWKEGSLATVFKNTKTISTGILTTTSSANTLSFNNAYGPSPSAYYIEALVMLSTTQITLNRKNQNGWTIQNINVYGI